MQLGVWGLCRRGSEVFPSWSVVFPPLPWPVGCSRVGPGYPVLASLLTVFQLVLWGFLGERSELHFLFLALTALVLCLVWQSGHPSWWQTCVPG